MHKLPETMVKRFLFVFVSALLLVASSSAQTGIFAAADRHLYLHCEGERHGPAVILEAGAYRDSSDWRKVQPAVARITQVCSYDREGLGKSQVDPQHDPEAESANEHCADLQHLLQTAKAPPPYILVGHSGGGVLIRRFTRNYPSEVVGMVLVDSSHEEQIWRFRTIDPSSIQGPPADPVKARLGGMLPEPGERLVWHYDIPLIVLYHGIPFKFDGSMAAHTDEFNAAMDAMAKDLASALQRDSFVLRREAGTISCSTSLNLSSKQFMMYGFRLAKRSDAEDREYPGGELKAVDVGPVKSLFSGMPYSAFAATVTHGRTAFRSF